jgi:pyruvate formate lyase activating enzyme
MIPVTLRQVIIPTLNDNGENIQELKKILDHHPCVDKIELLPFKKLCQVKYDMLGIPFPFADIPEPSSDIMSKLNDMIKIP